MDTKNSACGYMMNNLNNIEVDEVAGKNTVTIKGKDLPTGRNEQTEATFKKCSCNCGNHDVTVIFKPKKEKQPGILKRKLENVKNCCRLTRWQWFQLLSFITILALIIYLIVTVNEAAYDLTDIDHRIRALAAKQGIYV